MVLTATKAMTAPSKARFHPYNKVSDPVAVNWSEPEGKCNRQDQRREIWTHVDAQTPKDAGHCGASRREASSHDASSDAQINIGKRGDVCIPDLLDTDDEVRVKGE